MAELRYVNNAQPTARHGGAVRLEHFNGTRCVFCRRSNCPRLWVFQDVEGRGWTGVFGSASRAAVGRWITRRQTVIKRCASAFIMYSRSASNGRTNASSLYGGTSSKGSRPFSVHHLNLTVEVPLKAMPRGYASGWCDQWSQRKTGVSKLKSGWGALIFIVCMPLGSGSPWDYHRETSRRRGRRRR